ETTACEVSAEDSSTDFFFHLKKAKSQESRLQKVANRFAYFRLLFWSEARTGRRRLEPLALSEAA
ncbi:hypothetical protein NDU88_006285, partial [Pleurodeles waltl]